MAFKLCLRCDWSGTTRSNVCTRCGAQLFDQPDTERDAAHERSWRGWVATGLVIVIAAVAFVTIQRHTPSAPAATTGLKGYLVYPAADGQQVRLWIWNLATDTAQAGPVVSSMPSSIVSVYAVEDSWVGMTIPTATGGAAADILRSADPEAQPVTIAQGDSIAWQDGGSFVSSARSHRVQGCFRRVVVTTLSVTDRISRHTQPFLLCDRIVGLLRDSLSPYLVTVHNREAQTWRVFNDAISPVLTDYAPLGVSQNGDFLVRAAGGRAGMYYPTSSPGPNKPAMIALQGDPLLATKLLAWSVDGNLAYVRGSIGRVEGVFAVTVGPRQEPGAPVLVLRTSSTDVAASITVTNDLYVMAEGTLRYIHDDEVTSVLSPPSGAPRLAGPLLWVLSLPYSPSVAP